MKCLYQKQSRETYRSAFRRSASNGPDSLITYRSVLVYCIVLSQRNVDASKSDLVLHQHDWQRPWTEYTCAVNSYFVGNATFLPIIFQILLFRFRVLVVSMFPLNVSMSCPHRARVGKPLVGIGSELFSHRSGS